jgi:chromosome segregation ATPase
MDALKKENFGLKLRLFYMQERLSQQNRAENIDEILQENIEQKALLQERLKELEERNRLLMKARNAIETLQTDLEMARAQARQTKIVESHESQRLSQSSQQYRQQVLDMESQVASKNEQTKSLQDKVNTYQFKIDYYSEENEKLKETIHKLHAELQSLKMLEAETKIKRYEDAQEKLRTTQLQLDNKERVSVL